MTRIGKIALWMICGLSANVGLRAADTANNPLTGNPYGPVVIRNIFNLLPPPINSTNQAPQHPPKITVTGIYSVFGHPKVLFKISSGVQSGQAAGEGLHNLSQGDFAGAVMVVRIDTQKGVVTFKNNGVEQKVSLTGNQASADERGQ